MPDYPSPGVYVEEVPSAIKPIAGVSTSTAAFIGVVPGTIQQIAKDPAWTPEKPTIKWVDFEVLTPVNTAKLVTNWTQFTAAFGDIVGDPERAATRRQVPSAPRGTTSSPTRSTASSTMAAAAASSCASPPRPISTPR